MTLVEQARQCMKRQQWAAAVPLWQAMLQQPAARPLRVGWVSADFYAHPIGYFLASFLPHLSDEGVQSFCYHHGQQGRSTMFARNSSIDGPDLAGHGNAALNQQRFGWAVTANGKGPMAHS